MNFKRLGVAAAGVFLLAASTIFGQDAGRRLDGTANRLDRSPVSSSVGGLTTGRVTLSDGTTKITDDAGLTYNRTTDTLAATNGKITASNVTATGLATPGGITVVPTLSQIGAITVVAGASLIDGDALSVGDGTGTVPIEFDASPGDGTTGGAIPIIFDGTETATEIRDAVKTILDGAGRDWTTSNQGADGIGIVRATPGATGGAVTEAVGAAGFLVTDWTDPTHATTVTYQLVACLADGSCTQAGVDATTGGSTATLSASNFNRLSWSAVTGAASYKVYRKVAPTSPATVGVIYTGTALTVDDVGLAGDTTTASAVDGTGRVTLDGLTFAGGSTAGDVVACDALGNCAPAAGGGGITNAAGANVIPKSDGTNLVASAISEASAGSLATSAGTALGLTATAPAATTGASQAGKDVTITASPAVASTDTAGAAAGGNVKVVAGSASRFTAGNGVGGHIELSVGTGIGTGVKGLIVGTGGASGVANDADGIRIGADTGSGNPLSWYNNSITWRGSLGPDVIMGSAGGFGWAASTTETATTDTLVRRRAAANPAWGLASATPVSYTHSLAADSRAGTDTNIRGAKATLMSGIGTGTGGSGDFVQQTAYPGSTGTAANTPTDRTFLGSLWTNLTETTPTDLATLTFPASTAIGAEFLVTVSANDGDEYQSLTSRVRVSSVRKATGNTVSAVGVIGTDLLASSSRTLACTFAVTEGAAAAVLTANCTSTLDQTVLRASIQAAANGPVTIAQN